MAVENAKTFINTVNSDEALAQKLADAPDMNAIVTRANEMGYSFSHDELQAAIDEVYGELSEADLDNAAGGATDVFLKLDGIPGEARFLRKRPGRAKFEGPSFTDPNDFRNP